MPRLIRFKVPAQSQSSSSSPQGTAQAKFSAERRHDQLRIKFWVQLDSQKQALARLRNAQDELLASYKKTAKRHSEEGHELADRFPDRKCHTIAHEMLNLQREVHETLLLEESSQEFGPKEFKGDAKLVSEASHYTELGKTFRDKDAASMQSYQETLFGHLHASYSAQLRAFDDAFIPGYQQIWGLYRITVLLSGDYTKFFDSVYQMLSANSAKWSLKVEKPNTTHDLRGVVPVYQEDYRCERLPKQAPDCEAGRVLCFKHAGPYDSSAQHYLPKYFLGEQLKQHAPGMYVPVNYRGWSEGYTEIVCLSPEEVGRHGLGSEPELLGKIWESWRKRTQQHGLFQ